jgi:hypothetical protein
MGVGVSVDSAVIFMLPSRTDAEGSVALFVVLAVHLLKEYRH